MPTVFNFRPRSQIDYQYDGPAIDRRYNGPADCMMDDDNFTVRGASHRRKSYGNGVYFDRSSNHSLHAPPLIGGSVVSLHGAEKTRLKPCPHGFCKQAYDNGLQLVIGDGLTKDALENRCYNLLGSFAYYLNCADDPLETNYAWRQNCEFIEDFTCNGERVLNLHVLKAIRSRSQMIVAREGYLSPPT